jgi:hypothetical protein
MKFNKWTMALAAAGVVSLGSVAQAEEAQHQVLTALSSTTLSGYVDTSAIWKLGTDNRRAANYSGIPGRKFDGTADKLDGFNLHAVMLSLEKPLDEAAWAAGYKTDLVFGPDANFYQTLVNGGGSLGGQDVALKQAYVALRAPVGNGLDIKMGVFDTMIGYEVFESGNNPNFSRSYGFSLEPTHHTGVLASYHLTDWLSIAGGVANTSHGPINGRNAEAESAKTYLGSVVITMPDATGPLAGSVLYAGVVDGSTFPGWGLSDGTKNSRNIYVGGTLRTPVQGLSLGAAWDYHTDGPVSWARNPAGVIQQAPGTLGARLDNRAYAVAGYATYAFTDNFRANVRVDYLNADPGTFTRSALANNHRRERLLGSTLTLDYSLWDNVITRAEFRWDHSMSGDRPFGNENEKNAMTLAANIVYKF